VVNTQEFTRRVRFDLRFRRLEVRHIEQLTPNYVRVVAGGDELDGFQSLDPHDHVKLILPAPGETEPVLPTSAEDGIHWPEGVARPAMRDYTPRFVDADRNELTIDFVLHEDGLASNWARQAAPGHIIGTAGPRGSQIFNYDAFDWFLTGGDETSIPSIARRLEAVPAGKRVFAFIEVNGPEDEQELASEADATVTWVHRNGAAAGHTDVLEQALRAFTIPDGDGYLWFTGEANTLRGIRRLVLNEKGIDKSRANFSGHWKVGTTDFDHHEPIAD